MSNFSFYQIFKSGRWLLFVALATSLTTACTKNKPKEGSAVFIETSPGEDVSLGLGTNKSLNDFLKNYDPNDAAYKRAQFIHSVTFDAIETMTLRGKIIHSRALILHIQDLLPEKGNPFSHMVQFAQVTTKPAFVKAQNTDGSNEAYKKSIDGAENPVWLPTEEGQVLTDEVYQIEDVADIYNYFLMYIAVAEVMENLVQPVLDKSILVTPLQKSLPASHYALFVETWGRVKALAQTYRAKLQSNAFGQTLLKSHLRGAQALALSTLAGAMKPYIHLVETSTNEGALGQFLSTSDTLKPKSLLNVSIKEADVGSIKQKVQLAFSDSNPDYDLVKEALESVDLPDSGEIDGVEHSFEAVMRLEIGFDVMKELSKVIQAW